MTCPACDQEETYNLARAAWIPLRVYPSVDIPWSGPGVASSRHVVPLVWAAGQLGIVTPGGIVYHVWCWRRRALVLR